MKKYYCLLFVLFVLTYDALPQDKIDSVTPKKSKDSRRTETSRTEKEKLKFNLLWSWDCWANTSYYYESNDFSFNIYHFEAYLQRFIFGCSFTEGTRNGKSVIMGNDFYVGYAIPLKKYVQFPLEVGYCSANKFSKYPISLSAGILITFSPVSIGYHYSTFTGSGLLIGIGFN